MKHTATKDEKMALPAVLNSATGVFHPKDRRKRSPRCSIAEIDAKNRTAQSSGDEAASAGHRACKYCYV